MAATEALVFHVVNQGSCWLRIEGDPQLIPLTQGDLMVLPQGEGHQVADERATLQLSLRPITQVGPGCPTLPFGGDGPRTTMVWRVPLRAWRRATPA